VQTELELRPRKGQEIKNDGKKKGGGKKKAVAMVGSGGGGGGGKGGVSGMGGGKGRRPVAAEDGEKQRRGSKSRTRLQTRNNGDRTENPTSGGNENLIRGALGNREIGERASKKQRTAKGNNPRTGNEKKMG